MKSTIMIKTEPFDKLLQQIFSKKEISEIKKQAALECAYLRQFQKIIADALEEYLAKNNATIQDLAQEIGWSKYKINKFKNGEYNFTIPDVSCLLATIEKNPKDIFIL
jgi:hypothetical protein